MHNLIDGYVYQTFSLPDDLKEKKLVIDVKTSFQAMFYDLEIQTFIVNLY